MIPAYAAICGFSLHIDILDKKNRSVINRRFRPDACEFPEFGGKIENGPVIHKTSQTLFIDSVTPQGIGWRSVSSGCSDPAVTDLARKSQKKIHTPPIRPKT